MNEKDKLNEIRKLVRDHKCPRRYWADLSISYEWLEEDIVFLLKLLDE